MKINTLNSSGAQLAITPAPYAPDAPLGTPLTLIDASAGTGKTYTICERIVRATLNGELEIKDLALITFTRNAAQELRDRLRTFLSDPCKHIGVSLDDNDQRIERQKRSLLQLPGATIGTIHSFAIELISTVGVCGNVSPGRMLSESDLIFDEVFNDAIINSLHNPSLTKVLSKCANPRSKTCKNIQSHLFSKYTTPNTDESSTLEDIQQNQSVEHLLKEWGLAISSGYREQESITNTMSNDTILHIASNLLMHDAVKRLVRSRWRWLIVDEFQDTDTAQWEMVKRGFLDPLPDVPTSNHVILVGDPKQSIYRFRGADIQNYTRARDEVVAPYVANGDQSPEPAASSNRWFTLNKNYRSDEIVVEAINEISQDLTMGLDTPYDHVSAHHTKRRLILGDLQKAVGKYSQTEGDGSCAPDAGVIIRALLTTPIKEYIDLNTETTIAHDVALYVDACLNTVRIEESDDESDNQGASTRELKASDIAVLVRTGEQCGKVSSALRDLNIPSVIVRSNSVFSSSAARAWLEALQALGNPYHQTLVHTASVGLLGHLDDPLKLMQEQTLDSICGHWIDLQKLLMEEGFGAFWNHLKSAHQLQARLLGYPRGDELVVDTVHIAELLQEQWQQKPTIDALIAWLSSEIANNDGNASVDETKRRLPTDLPAVKIMTYHGSKGLQFPLVLMPYILNPKRSQPSSSFNIFDSATDRLVFYDNTAKEIDITIAELKERSNQLEREEIGRLEYVALTRAAMLAVLWAPTFTRHSSKKFSPLQELIYQSMDKFGADSKVKEPENIIVVNEAIKERVEAFVADMTERCHARRSETLAHSLQHADLLQLDMAFTQPVEASFEQLCAEGGGARQQTKPPCARHESAQDLSIPPQIRTSYSGITKRLTPIEPDAQEPYALPSSVYTHDEGDDESLIVDDTATTTASEVPVATQDTEPTKLPYADESPIDTTTIEDVSKNTVESTPFVGNTWSAESEMTAEHFPMIEMPAGTSFGTCIHSAFERLILQRKSVDNQSLEDAALLVGQAIQRRYSSLDSNLLAQAMQQAYQTNLGPHINNLSLAEIDPHNIRPELEFDFSLKTSSGMQAFREICQVWREEISKDDPVYEYADLLEQSINNKLTLLRGIMTGSIDVFARVNGAHHIMDWKTNRLSPYGTTPHLYHYDQSAVLHAMYHHDYLLQALIYSVATYNMLNTKARPVTPEMLGGVAYLFVRGMNPSVQLKCGAPFAVFTWKPPFNLIKRVSHILNTSAR